MTDTTTLLKQQFSDLCAQRDAILSTSVPLRQQRDQAVTEAMASVQPTVDQLNSQIAEAEARLPAVMKQISDLVIVLEGQTS